MGRFLSDMVPNGPLSLLKEFTCFDNLKELYILFVSTLQLGVYDPIHSSSLNAVRVERPSVPSFEVSNGNIKYG